MAGSAALSEVQQCPLLQPVQRNLDMPSPSLQRVVSQGPEGDAAPVRVDVGGDPGIEYRLVPGCSRYAVGRDGSFWSRFTKGNPHGWGPLPGAKDRKGYLKASARLDTGAYLKTFLHTLVLLAFVGPRPKGMQARHRDGNNRNNRADNLTWGTNLENAADRQKHGTYYLGSRHHNAKLDETQVKQVWKMLRKGVNPTAIAAKFGVYRSTVKSIEKGATWDHVTSTLEPR